MNETWAGFFWGLAWLPFGILIGSHLARGSEESRNEVIGWAILATGAFAGIALALTWLGASR